MTTFDGLSADDWSPMVAAAADGHGLDYQEAADILAPAFAVLRDAVADLEARKGETWEQADDLVLRADVLALLQEDDAGCRCDACTKDGFHKSDCAVHNGPAFPVGPCDCGLKGAQQ